MTTDPTRLDALERALSRLTLELAEARRELAALRLAPPAARDETPLRSRHAEGGAPLRPPSAAGDPPGARAATSAPSRRVARPDVEKLIGRYGALALAVLTIVMGAGALVSWAIRQGLLGPWARVALGTLLALAIAGAGTRLRARGVRRFGNVLLALALAVLHVVAWGAGPALGLVPSWLALTVADAASVALAVLAFREDAELLFTVGLGGALLAPFVMTTGAPRLGVLAAYGLIVLTTAVVTIGARAWSKAVLLAVLGVVVYTPALGEFAGGSAWVNREFAPAFAALIAGVALIVGRPPARTWIAITATLMMAIALGTAHVRPFGGSHLAALVASPDIPIAAMTGTALFLTAARGLEGERRFPVWLFAVALVPAQFLAATLGATGPARGVVSGALVLAWAAAYAVASLAEQGRRRGLLLAACGVASVWAITLVFDRAPEAVAPVLAAHAVVFAMVARREQQPAALVATGTSLVVASIIAARTIVALPGYRAMPFLSLASLGAACVVAAAYLSARSGLPERVPLVGGEFARDRIALLVSGALAFLWGHFELRRAFSADASTFLLIVYYASCGVLSIRAGRRAGERRLRQVGLALAVLAALFAIVKAAGVQQIGLRVGSYLLVGAFLLGVAWWYFGEERGGKGEGSGEG